MGAKIHLTDGNSKKHARVTDDNELLVSVSSFPPFGEQKATPFRQYFTLDGTATGDNDMGQNGSTTNLDYYVPADPEKERYITHLSVILGYGTTGQPFQFADGTALTNGVRFFYRSVRGEVDIHEAIKNNQDFFRLASSQIPNNWEVRGVGANNDYGYFIHIELTQFIPNYGVKLDAGTNQRMIFRIRDTMAAADTFNIIAYGYERYK